MKEERSPALPLVRRTGAVAPADEALRRITEAVSRGVCRMFEDNGHGTLVEFRLPNGRRVDVMTLGPASEFAIVEVKASVEDFRGDLKWPDYLPWCDAFYFAVPEGFPLALLPAEHGVIVADAYEAAIIRPSAAFALHAARRRSQLLRFALTASARLARLADPRP
ncbi:MAG: MmcB family DNA repair protein [Alphaproteobacteria bacterium]|nr:MmcB family DNA repair protein [Alphaproteobacteria bacterium]